MTAVAVCAAAPSLQAQRAGRFLAKEDIVLLGVGLRVEPAQQTVPKDIATIVSTPSFSSDHASERVRGISPQDRKCFR